MNKFLKEITEQPESLRDTLDLYLDGKGKDRLEELSGIWSGEGFRQVLFTGMGSSYFVSYMASSLLSHYGIRSCVVNAGEMLHYHRSLVTKDTLVVCVSQSGESYETVKVLEGLPDWAASIAITNERDSALAKRSSLALYSLAGEEGMTSTKTYVCTVLLMNIFAHTLADRWNETTQQDAVQALAGVESLLGNYLEWIDPVMKFINDPSFISMIGRGPAYSSVMQSALMVMEAAGSPASGLFGGEFRHGPMEMVKEGFVTVVFAPEGNTFEQSMKMAGDIASFGGRVVLVTDRAVPGGNPRIFPIRVPASTEYLFPISAIIPLQIIVNQLALDRGIEPGSFTRGSKVTLTE